MYIQNTANADKRAHLSCLIPTARWLGFDGKNGSIYIYIYRKKMPFQSNSGLTMQVSKMLINIVHLRVPKEYMVL